MKHVFHPSITDNTICVSCKFREIDHTDRATCEVCSNSGPVELVYGNILMCSECWEKEQLAQVENAKGVEQRVNNAHAVLDKARTIDYSIHVIQDIFNAETISIAEIKSAIDSDDTIVEKHFELAKAVDDRFSHFQMVIDAARDTIRENESRQRNIQQYYNELSNKLRAEQREQIKLKDVNYKTIEKKIAKPKAPTTKKLNKAELIQTANKLSKEYPQIPVNLIMPNLQTLVISRNMNLEQAANVLRGMFGGKL